MFTEEYICFSKNLCTFLYDNKFIPKKTGIHSDTGNPYAVFDLTEALSTALYAWSNKKINIGVIHKNGREERKSF